MNYWGIFFFGGICVFGLVCGVASIAAILVETVRGGRK